MIIRAAKKRDISGLLLLLEQMSEHHAKIDSYYKPFSQFTGLEEEIAGWLLNKDMLVLAAEDGGRLIGYAHVSVEDAPTYASVKKIGVIYDVFVVPAYRRKKIAKELLEKAMAWFDKKKVRYVELSVDARNDEGVRFWRASGFADYKLKMRSDLEKNS